MRALLPLLTYGLLYLPLVNGVAAPKCQSDDCLSLVKQGKKAGGRGNCSGFLRKTVIPKAITKTVKSTKTLSTTNTQLTTTTVTTTGTFSTTFTGTSTSTISTTLTTTASPISKRAAAARTTISSTQVPQYAQDQCTNVQQYSSACECVGVQVQTTTAATPTATKTQTLTTTLSASATSTVTSTAGDVTTKTVSASTTVTTTTTTTTTVTSSPTCATDYRGTTWAYFTSTQGGHDDPNYSQFDPTDFKFQDPNYSSVTYTIGGVQNANPPNSVQIYNAPGFFSSRYFALVNRGFFFPPSDGIYTVTLSGVNDIGLFWLGSPAYSGFSRNNADIITTSNPDTQAPGSSFAQYYFTEGFYYPFRIMLGQATAGYGLTISITDESGAVVVDSSTGANDMIVTQSCDGIDAPMFPPFGSES